MTIAAAGSARWLDRRIDRDSPSLDRTEVQRPTAAARRRPLGDSLVQAARPAVIPREATDRRQHNGFAPDPETVFRVAFRAVARTGGGFAQARQTSRRWFSFDHDALGREAPVPPWLAADPRDTPAYRPGRKIYAASATAAVAMNTVAPAPPPPPLGGLAVRPAMFAAAALLLVLLLLLLWAVARRAIRQCARAVPVAPPEAAPPAVPPTIPHGIAGSIQPEAAHTLLATIAESSHLAIIGATLDGTITSWNVGAERIYGHSVDQVVGRNIRLIVPKSRSAFLPPILERLARGEQVELVETQSLRKDGTHVLTVVTITPVRGPDGAVIGSTSIALDVTDRRQALDALLYRDRLLHAVASGTATLLHAPSLDAGMPEALRLIGETLQVDRVIVMRQEDPLRTPPRLQFIWEAPGIAHPFDRDALDAPLTTQDLAAWQGPLTERRPVITQRATAPETIRAVLEKQGNVSTLQIPIFTDGRFWGSLGIDSCAIVHDWNEAEIDTCLLFADALGALLQRTEAWRALERSEERFRVLSATAQDAIIITDAEGVITYWNAAAQRILGHTEAEAVGQNMHSLILPVHDRVHAEQEIRDFARTGVDPEGGKIRELTALRKDGVEIPIELALSTMTLDATHFIVGILRDISERKQASEQIQRMAHEDALTGLVNREVFVRTLQRAIARARRGGEGFAILYLDLDHFKDVNDTLGHPVGDLLLHAVAQRLRASVRETDTVARFGGDEFAVIGEGITEPASAAELAAKLQRATSDPVRVQDHDLRTAASIGIAMYGPDSPDAETLLSHADVALYRAKAEGRDTYRFFTDAMDAEVRTRVTTTTELRRAIAEDQLFLQYQPQVAVPGGRIVGVEALVRWRHPTRGVVGPDAFIGIAEHSGVIVDLGRWVLRTACIQARQWLDAGIAPVVAINLSAMQFKTPHELRNSLVAILAETAMPAGTIELELTESVLMEAEQGGNDVLLQFRRDGFRIAIDDFGTGYSSLDYLRRFPVDRIKIAQVFIAGLGTEPGNAAIVRASLGLARELGITAIAEGVETRAQYTLLRDWGCREIQGYYFSRPLSAEAVTALLHIGSITPEDLAEA